jgi:uncharacterized lipoprotein YmbA
MRGPGPERFGGVVAAVMLVAGCASSAPLRFYTLSEVAPRGAEAAPVGGISAIRVGRVKIPAELDRTELVQRIDANRLSIGELDRWAAPLDDMIRRVLSADLQARAASATAAQSPSTLTVDIEEFIGDAACAVSLTASWELKKSNGAENVLPQTGREVIQVPAPGSSACPPGALPMPMSQAIAQLSERILAASH